jgi:hypothetical protein
MAERGFLDCEAMGHVGPESDGSVHWRGLGLMCDTCYAAFGDTRPLQRQVEELRDELEDTRADWKKMKGVVERLRKANTDD